MKRDSKNKLSSITVSLHWIVGIMMMMLLGVGIYMAENKAYDMYATHKSLGVIIFAFVLARIIWRIMNGWPQDIANSKKAEYLIGLIVHWVLIIGTVMLPISGMLMSGMGGHGVSVFGLELMAENMDPANPGKALPLNGPIAGLAHTMHSIGGYMVVIALIAHIAGALKHHLVLKNDVLRRMLGKQVG